MIKTSDIYYKVDSKIVENDFWNVDINGKKELIDIELKNYMISKILELNSSVEFLNNLKDKLTPIDYLEILSKMVQKEEQGEILRHFIHYILNVIGSLQNHSVIWYQEDDESLIEKPTISFKNNVLDELKTHQETNYLKIFSGIYKVFRNEFLIVENDKKLIKEIV